MPSNYRGSLLGVTNVTLDLSTARATFSNLSINAVGVSYLIEITIATTPSSAYGLSENLESFDVVDPNAITYSGEPVRLTLRFIADYATVAAGQEEALEIYFLNQIAPEYANASFSNVEISEGKYRINIPIRPLNLSANCQTFYQSILITFDDSIFSSTQLPLLCLLKTSSQGHSFTCFIFVFIK